MWEAMLPFVGFMVSTSSFGFGTACVAVVGMDELLGMKLYHFKHGSINMGVWQSS